MVAQILPDLTLGAKLAQSPRCDSLWHMNIKRGLPRLHRRLSLKLGEHQAFTQDISPGGLCVELDPAPAPGWVLQGELELDGRSFPFAGQVAWREQGRVGVAFTEIGNAFFARLKPLDGAR